MKRSEFKSKGRDRKAVPLYNSCPYIFNDLLSGYLVKSTSKSVNLNHKIRSHAPELGGISDPDSLGLIGILINGV